MKNITNFFLIIFIILSINLFGQPIHIDLGTSIPTSLFVFNDKLYFSSPLNSNGNNELWVYDNYEPISETNPKMLIDLNNDPTIASFPRFFTEYNNKLFFRTNFGLYSYEDNLPISETNPRYIGLAGNGLIVYDNKLYYEVYEQNVRTMWIFDDNLPLSSTNPKKLVSPSTNSFTTSNNFSPFIFQNKLYFSAKNNLNSNNEELWCFNFSLPASATNPFLFKEINANYNEGSTPTDFILYKNKMYFSANDGTGTELWVYDGSQPPYKVYDIDPNPYGGLAKFKTIYQDTLFFSGHNNEYGTELWAYDGINPPFLVADILEGADFSIPWNLKVFGNKLIFSADDEINGRELWCYNNNESVSTNNPFILFDLYQGSEDGIITTIDNHFVIYNNLLFFGGKMNYSTGGLYAISLCDIGDTEPPIFNLGEDIQIYFDETVTLEGPPNMVSYEWSDGSANSTFNLIGNYNIVGINNISLTVFDENQCSYSDNINITVIDIPSAPIANAATNISDNSFVANWNYSTNATGYYLDVALDNEFGNILANYNNLEVGNINFYSVNTNENVYYRLRAYNGSGISSNSETISVNITNIEYLKDFGISIYPNPTSNNLILEFSNNKINSIKIFDMTGKQVIEKTEIRQNEMIDLSNFDSGIYNIRIFTDNETLTTKILKK